MFKTEILNDGFGRTCHLCDRNREADALCGTGSVCEWRVDPDRTGWKEL